MVCIIEKVVVEVVEVGVGMLDIYLNVGYIISDVVVVIVVCI